MDATAAPPLESVISRSRPAWKTYTLRTLIWLAIAAALAVCAAAGIHLRWWVYNATDPIRFIDDMRRGTYWGLHASAPKGEGFLNQYDKMDPQVPEWQDDRWQPWLDYSPLRLAVMYGWGWWQWHYHPPDLNAPLMDAWKRDHWFSNPVLYFNTSLEALSSIFAFLLTRLWVVRGTPLERRRHFTGVWQGAAAALFVWFSPDLILNSHGWVQWDTWVVPWYLLAVLLASLDWWFAAGAAIAIGINFKGQMIPITPIFLIWPLVQGRVGAALRWICGVVFCYAVIVSPWLLSYLPPNLVAAKRDVQANLNVIDYPLDFFAIPRIFDVAAAIWIGEMLIAAGNAYWILQALLPKNQPLIPSTDSAVAAQAGDSPTRELTRIQAHLQSILRSRWTWITFAAVIVFSSVYWPWLLPQNRSAWYIGILLAPVVTALALSGLRKIQPYFLAAIAGAGLFSCIWLFHGDSAWYDCAVRFGSNHWPYLMIGATSNVPAIFQFRFNWSRDITDIAFTLPAIHAHWPAFVTSRGWWPAVDTDITDKVMFNTIYGVLLLISGIAIGIQTRRNDRRALVAFVTPWVVFFLWPVQIQERYLLYGAAAAACCIGDSVGAALLGLLLTIFSFMMPFKEMLETGWSNDDNFGQNLSNALPWLFSPDAGNTLHHYLEGTQPDIAWGILVISFVLIYLSVTPSRRSGL